MEKKIDKEQSVIVIGHSLGGLVGSRLHTKGWKIDLLITVGSPLKGAAILKYFNQIIPKIMQKPFMTPVKKNLYRMIDDIIDEPPHPYHCFTMSLPTSDNFDGCIFVNEARFKDEHHTHLPYADHWLIFVNPRLLTRIDKKIKSKL